MFKHKNKTGCETPIFRKPTEPPNPNTDCNPPNRGSSVQPPKKHCSYETPCGWCSKWDKKCDNVIGISKDGMFDLSLWHDGLVNVLCGDQAIQCIKVTTAFHSYLERRYARHDITTSLRHNEVPVSEFMGVPVVVNDSIIYPYEVVYKGCGQNGY